MTAPSREGKVDQPLASEVGPHSAGWRVVTLARRLSGRELEPFRQQALERAQARDWPPGCRRRALAQTVDKAYARGEPPADVVEEYGFAEAEDALCWRQQLQATDSTATHLLVQAVVQKPRAGVPEPGALQVIQWVRRSPGLALAEFRRYWRDVHGPLVAPCPSVAWYEQYPCADAEYAFGTEWDGLALIGFDSSAAMRAYGEDPISQAVTQDALRFVAPGAMPFIVSTAVWAEERG